jgi:hypothetical protein
LKKPEEDTDEGPGAKLRELFTEISVDRIFYVPDIRGPGK